MRNAKKFRVTAYDKDHKMVGSHTMFAETEEDAEENFRDLRDDGFYDDALYCEVEEED